MAGSGEPVLAATVISRTTLVAIFPRLAPLISRFFWSHCRPIARPRLRRSPLRAAARRSNRGESTARHRPGTRPPPARGADGGASLEDLGPVRVARAQSHQPELRTCATFGFQAAGGTDRPLKCSGRSVPPAGAAHLRDVR